MSTCSLCPGRKFKTAEALHQHKIDTKSHFYCQTCKQDSPDVLALIEHYVSLHPSRVCSNCQRIFSDRESLKKHLYDSPKHVNCKLCHKGFRDDAEYLAHKRNKHPKGRKLKRRMNPVAKPPASPHSSVSGDSMPPTPSPSGERSRKDLQLKVILSPEPEGRTPDLPDADIFADAFLSGKASPTQGSFPSSGGNESSDTVTTASESSGSFCATSLPCASEGASSFPTCHNLRELSEEHSALELRLSGHEADFSPLLMYADPAPSERCSDVSDGDSDPRDSSRLEGRTPPRKRTPSLEAIRSERSSLRQCSPASLSLSARRVNALTDEMKSSWRARYEATVGSSSPQSQERLPTSTVPALLSPLSLASSASDDSRTYLLPPEVSPSYRRPGLRARRLSMSPTLPAIPEALPSTDKPHDPDTESPLGTHEHSADDFLYDNLSEAGQSVASLTYHSANDETREEEDSEDDHETFSAASYPSPPALVIEDLTQLAHEICISPFGDENDPFADPFELHPSATNSPMETTFNVRPRAWSVGPPEREPAETDREEGTEAGELDEARHLKAPSPLTVKVEEDEAETMLSSPQFSEEYRPLHVQAALQSPVASQRCSRSTSYSSKASSAAGSSAAPPGPKLYCRLCSANPCREPTATFCGHVFCYGCISEEVMAKSRCPTCLSPTLLYCLFKLDLS